MQNRHRTANHSTRHALGAVAVTATVALLGAFSAPAFAADATTGSSADIAKTQYLKDRANCENGKTAEDRATCLKEAGAAEVERKRHQLDTDGSTAQNATDRCNLLPGKDRTDCLARVQGPSRPNQVVTKSGSVAGGGIIKETTTTTTGPLIVIPVPAVPAASATN